MRTVVITPPAALVSAADAKKWAPAFVGDDDARVEALLLAAQASIEPPNGWVGRAFGVQVLEARCDGFLYPGGFALPFPPLRAVASVKYDDPAGVEQILPTSAYRVAGVGTSQGYVFFAGASAGPATALQADAVRVRFTAGYDADSQELLPARHAIVLAATHLRSLTTQDLALRSRDVPGVGSRTWTVSDQAEKLIRSAVEGLLAGYRVWSL